MEHNLGDALNLEGAISNMDFDQSDVVVSEGDITLESEVHDIPMEFENIEEEQIMMDTGSEEVIVSEFMGDQLSLQDYCIKHKEQQHEIEVPTETETVQPNVITTHIETLPEFQYEPENIRIIKQEPVQKPKRIPIKAGATLIKNIAPKQVMIAPKPSKLPTGGSQKSVLTKQYAIAPKPAPRPVQLVKSSVMKVSLANLMKGNSKPIIAQLDGKLMMLPSRSTQKIKLLPASGTPVYIKTNDRQSQLITAKLTQPSKQIKPVLTKVIQGQSSVEASNQPAVITKLVPVSSAGGSVQARYVMKPKTVPIGGNKVLLSPTNSNVKFAKKQQLIAVKSSPSKLLSAPAQSTAKKVVISASSSQNMILKAAPTNTVMSKDGSLLLTPGQRTQLHQINVPGKGVQYIRLVTNSAATAKPKPAAQSNTIMVTDSKGNLIPLTEKVSGTQPPVLVINSSNSNKNIQKTPKKLVRIAPVTSKASQIVQKPRSSQSLLVPLSAPEVSQTEESKYSDEKSVDLENLQVGDFYIEQPESSQESRSLLAQNTEMHKLDDAHNISEVVVDYETSEMQSPEDTNSTEGNCKAEKQEAPLIVIPSNYKQIKEDDSKEKTLVFMDDSQDMPTLEKPESTGPGLNIEAEIVPYLSPSSPPLLSDNETSRTGELGRPRKACNCAKSQCLKLYCDCFANGEFCNKCNCDNCHNNLENEELRQKAIRACLERNPNAFRPKIGKAKVGGPEPIRRHTKGCNCKRSGCLKNYCECFEAKIECTATCKCVGCRNVEDTAGKCRPPPDETRFDSMYRPPLNSNCRLPCSFVTVGVIEAVCQCLIAAASEGERAQGAAVDPETVDPVKGVIEEFSRCLQDIISASHQAPPLLVEE